MDFEVYCDESRQDLFTTHAQNKHGFLMIGSLWLPASLREDIKMKAAELRNRYNVWGEIKWVKVSPSKSGFYAELVDLFVSYGDNLRFRCIAVDADKVDMRLHGNDEELGFYKFYYQMLHHRILDFNNYSIFCDIKCNHDLERLHVLRKCLSNANLTSVISRVQALPSKEVLLIQLTDFLLGMASARLNHSIQPGGVKDEIIKRLERHLHIARLGPTPWTEKKFNVFKIRLGGGW